MSIFLSMIPLPVRLGLIGLIGGTLFVLGMMHGESVVNAKWTAQRAATQVAEASAINARLADNAKLEAKHAADNAALTKAHDEEIQKLSVAYRAARSTGLRISASACDRPAKTASAESSSGSNDAATIQLPPETERRLFNLAEDADKCSVQLTTLQKWLHANSLD